VVYKSISWISNPSRGIQIRLVVFSPSHGIQISFVVFKSVSWYLNPSRGIFKPVTWYSNPTRGIQIRLVVFKFVLWHSYLSRGGQICLRGIQICLSFKINGLRQYCG